MSATPQPFEIVAAPDRVDAWSAFRLPFEPRDEKLEFRRRLRSAIEGLERRPALHAEYVSADTSFCDVENVLLYNVGSFKGLGTKAILLERRYEPAAPPPSGQAFPHLVRYCPTAEDQPWQSWRPQKLLLTIESRPVATAITTASVWAALRAGRSEPRATWNQRDPLGITIRLTSPRALSLVANIKALLDGAVAAAQAHDGSDLPAVSSALAEKLGAEPDQIAKWLTDRRAAVLGVTRLIRPRQRGVQWYPADDWLTAIRLTAAEGSETRVSVTLHTVA